LRCLRGNQRRGARQRQENTRHPLAKNRLAHRATPRDSSPEDRLLTRAAQRRWHPGQPQAYNGSPEARRARAVWYDLRCFINALRMVMDHRRAIIIGAGPDGAVAADASARTRSRPGRGG
jgi:hypothetical protein